MNLVFLGLLWVISAAFSSPFETRFLRCYPGFVDALPQPQASVTLFEFEPSVSSGPILGTEWAQPIGTAGDGSNTTFVLVDEISTSGLVMTDGSAELITTTVTNFGVCPIESRKAAL